MKRLLVLLLTFLTILIFTQAKPAQAATLTVTVLTDTGAAACELRDAITRLNLGSDGAGCVNSSIDPYGTNDQINFTTPAGTITLGSVMTSPAAGKNITINTPPNATSITGSNARRIFDFTTGGTLTINGLTLTNGQSTGVSPDVVGGAIRLTSGTLTLTNCTVQNSTASGAGTNNGGAIFVSGTSTLNINSGTVSGNHADDNGGGIAVTGGTVNLTGVTINGTNDADVNGGGIFASAGTLTISNSTISSNQASAGGGSQNGGGIALSGTAALSLTGSTISNNDCDDDGAGILNTSSGVVTITNSTISGNNAGDDGGGINNSGANLTITGSTINGNDANDTGGGILNTGVTLTIKNSTISGNTCSNDGAGIRNEGGATGIINLNNLTITDNTPGGGGGDDGGGISNAASSVVNLSNTILAGNNFGGGTGPDCEGTLNSNDYNLIGNTTGCTVGGTTTHNITGLNPQLGPLQNNGGTTSTHAITSNSPAFNAGNPATPAGSPTCETTDQRGTARPQLTLCDIGAFELASTQVPGTIEFSAPSYSVNENAGPVTVTAKRLNGSHGQVSISYTTTDGTAIAGTDYTATSSTLTWTDGDTADKTFNVTILDNANIDGTRSFFVSFDNVTGGATIGGPNEAEIFIFDNDAPGLNYSTGTLAFTAAVGSTDGPNTITLINSGNAPVDIGQADIIGDNPTNFLISTDNCSGATVAGSGGTCTFDLSFTPNAVASFAALVRFPSTDPNSPLLIAVAGTGTANPIATTTPPDASTIDFGTVTVGATSTPQLVELRNTGTTVLTLSSDATVSGGDFSILTTNGGTSSNTCLSGLQLNPGDTCVLQVVFSPTSSGPQGPETLVFTTDGGNPSIDLVGSGQDNIVPLSISKTVDNPSALIGDTRTFTITVTNNGTIDALNLSITDQTNGNFDITSVNGISSGSGTVTCVPNLGSAAGSISNNCTVDFLESGETVTIDIQGDVLDLGEIDNTASVSSSGTVDPDLSDNTAGASINAAPGQTDLSITKTVDFSSGIVGDTRTFTIVVTNTGSIDALNINLTDQTNGEFNITNVSGSTTGSGTLTCSNNTGSASSSLSNDCTLDVLEAGETLTLTIDGDITGIGEIDNIASVSSSGTTDINTSNNTSSASIHATAARADLGLTKTVDNPTAQVGDVVTFQVVVTNKDASVTADTINITDITTGNINVTGFTTTAASCTPTPSLPASAAFPTPVVLDCTLGTLAPLATETITVTGTVTGDGEIENTAAVSSSGTSDPNTSNNAATASVNASLVELFADLALTKNSNNSLVVVGVPVTYSFTVTNLVGSSTATGVQFVDVISTSSDSTFSVGGFTGATCTATPASGASSVVTCSLGSLAAGGSVTFTMEVIPNGPGVHTITNLATVQSNENDPNFQNSVAAFAILAAPSTNVLIAGVPPAPPTSGGCTFVPADTASSANLVWLALAAPMALMGLRARRRR